MNRKLVIKGRNMDVKHDDHTMLGQSGGQRSVAPAAAARQKTSRRRGNGKTEEIKPAETNLSEAKPEDAIRREKNLERLAPPAENRLRRKKREKPFRQRRERRERKADGGRL